ncbi:MAG TPA: peptidoglycan recognition family protein [Candidatus Krumholzibacteria bacterium]|nr:peptidoglycan recognition family protein [Candidatus Krumholzibacteria bacterium]HPD70582.1 peptidoglycan recognition family protein [Candidatus Krumholzibacteria bacterium]HRY39718.1 peptidoglycan recognition family protein [Candidatus Krumholzibacteria bacterium]
MPLSIDRSLRLPPDQYLPPSGPKTGIAIHHTVGGSARSTFDWWLRDGEQIGTAYLIERDGRIHEVFPPEAWAWQFGLKWSSARKIAFERRFIGIELASEGGLIERDGKLYCFERISPRCEKSRADAFDHGHPYRGYRYFDRYEKAQLDSLVALVDDLLGRFGIPRRRPDRPLDFHGEQLERFTGVIGHAMVRADKTDPAPDPELWERLTREIGIVAVNGGGAPPAAAPAVAAVAAGIPDDRPTPLDETAQLFADNVTELNKLKPAAGSLVKCLIMELERDARSTYIRLHDAVPGGHRVRYTFVRGRADLVGRLARALRFARVTDTELEVRGG